MTVELLQPGKLLTVTPLALQNDIIRVCLIHGEKKGFYRLSESDKRHLIQPGAPMLLLKDRREQGAGGGKLNFLVEESLVTLAFLYGDAKLSKYLIPLEEWDEYKKFWNEYYQEIPKALII